MSEPTPPGHIDTPRVELRWDAEGLAVLRAPGWPAGAEATGVVMALNRCARSQELGFIGRLFGREAREEDWLIVELRAGGERELVLTARAPGPEALEGLCAAEPHGERVDYDALRALMLAIRDHGGLVAVGAHAYVPEEEAPLAALPSPDDAGIAVEDSDALRRALNGAQEGQVLQLGPGDFTVQSARIQRGIHIVGDGPELTRLHIESGASWGLQLAADGILLRALSILGESPRAPGLIQVEDAAITLLDCTLRPHADDAQAIGVEARGGSRLHIERCALSGFQSALVADDTSSVRVHRSELRDNFVGADFEGASEGTVAGNIWRDNSSALRLKGTSTVWVDANTFLGSSVCGVEIAAQARARLTRNRLEGGGRGVIVRTSYPAEIEDNLCVHHHDAGVLLGETHGGTLARNECRWNRHGIEATDLNCDASLHDNTCSENRQCGIRVGAGARLHIVENTCDENDIGILVDDPPGRDDNTPGPHLEHNHCDHNRVAGIRFAGPGTARANTCIDNGHHDIDVTSASQQIHLHDNLTSTVSFD